MAGKKKRGVGGKPGTPRGSIAIVTKQAGDEPQADSEPASPEVRSAEQLALVNPTAGSSAGDSHEAVVAPPDKVRRKKVDNGDDRDVLGKSNGLSSTRNEQHAISNIRVVSVGESLGTGVSGEAIDSDWNTRIADAKEDHANGHPVHFDEGTAFAAAQVPIEAVDEMMIMKREVLLEQNEAGLEETDGGGWNESLSDIELEGLVQGDESTPASLFGSKEADIANVQTYAEESVSKSQCAESSSVEGFLENCVVQDSDPVVDTMVSNTGTVSGEESTTRNGSDGLIEEAGPMVDRIEPSGSSESVLDYVKLSSSLEPECPSGDSDVKGFENATAKGDAGMLESVPLLQVEDVETMVVEPAAVVDNSGQSISLLRSSSRGADTDQPAQLPSAFLAENEREIVILPTTLQPPNSQADSHLPSTVQTASQSQPIGHSDQEPLQALISPPQQPSLNVNPPANFLSPTRSISFGLASADDDTAFFEQLLEDSDEDEVTSRPEVTSSRSSFTLGKGPVQHGVLGQAIAAQSGQDKGPSPAGSPARPPIEVFSPPQVQLAEVSPPASIGAVPFGPVSPPEFSQQAKGVGQGFKLEFGSGSSLTGLRSEGLGGASGSGVRVVESSAVGNNKPPQVSHPGSAPLAVAVPCNTLDLSAQNAQSWNFPTPRGDEDIEYFAAATPQGGQPQQALSPASFPSFPPVEWQQPSQQQPGGPVVSNWVAPAGPAAWAYPPFQDDDVSFFNQETPKGFEAPQSFPPPPLSSNPFLGVANTDPTGQAFVLAPPSSWSFPSPVGADDEASFFEQAAASPPAQTLGQGPGQKTEPLAPPPVNQVVLRGPEQGGEPQPGRAEVLNSAEKSQFAELGGSDTSPGGLDASPGVSDTAAVVATATVAAVVASVPSWNFGMGDEGDVSFFESIGGQEEGPEGGEQPIGQKEAAVPESYAEPGIPPSAGQDWYAGNQSQYPVTQPSEATQYWSDQYNQSYDWSQYQQPSGAYSHLVPGGAPEQGAYSHPAPSSAPGQGAFTGQDPAYSQPPSESQAPAAVAFDQSAFSQHGYSEVGAAYNEQSTSWFGSQGGETWQPQGAATWQSQGGATWPAGVGQDWGFASEQVDPEQFFEQIGAEPEASGALVSNGAPSSALPGQLADTGGKQSDSDTLHDLGEGVPSQVPVEETPQEPLFSPPQHSELSSPQRSELPPPQQGEVLSPQQAQLSSAPNPFLGTPESQYASEEAQGSTPMDNQYPAQHSQLPFSPENQYPSQQAQFSFPLENQYPSQQAQFSSPLENQYPPPQAQFSSPLENQYSSQQAHFSSPLENQYPSQQAQFSSPLENQYPPQQAQFSSPLANQYPPQQAQFSSPQENQFPSQQAQFSLPLESQYAPEQALGQGFGPLAEQSPESFFEGGYSGLLSQETKPLSAHSLQQPLGVTNFATPPQTSAHAHPALPRLPPGHSRNASATSQSGSEHDWAAANFSQPSFPAFIPRPPFVPQPFVPAGVNFFQPPKQSTPAFIPAQADYGGSGFGAFGQWVQHTAVPRSTAEAMQTSVGRPPCSVVTFGFGGKLVVLKPRESLSIGSDMGPPGVSFGAAQSSLQIHTLSQVVTLNATDGGKGVASLYFEALGKRAFAGPLAGGHTPAKEITKWLDERMARCREEETDHQSNPETLRLLYGLLKVAAQNYGKLRAVAAPGGGQEKGGVGPETALAALLSSSEQPGAASSWGVTKTRASDPLQHPPSEQDLKRSATEMQRLLVAGNRKEALACARQGQLWGPALVLARQLGDKVFCETVGEMAQRQFSLGSPLRTLHLLLAQQPADVFAGKKMPAQGDSPMAGGPQQAPGGDQGDGLGSMLDQWQENLAILAANRAAGDDKVITHLGDCLWRTRGEVAAAHMCYLVADAQPEAFSGTSRVCLIGVDQYKYPRTFATPEGIQRTELYEHAKMLGNSQFLLPTFQPYKLLYASMLAEAGKTAEALRYCQLVLKTLRAGGRSPDFEAIRQGATVLEDRLQNHTRSGSATSSTKLFSGIFKAVDWGIKGIMGGGSRPNSPPKEEAPPAVPSWGSGNAVLTGGNGNSGAFLVGHQWAAQVQGPSQQWGESVPGFLPPGGEREHNVGGYAPPESNPPQSQWGVQATSSAWQVGATPGGGSAHSSRPPTPGQSSWSANPVTGGPSQGEDAEGGGSAFSSRPPTPGQSQSWNPSPAVSSGSRPSSPAGQTQSQQWGGQPGASSGLGGQWAAQSAPLISAYENQAVASTAESSVSKPPTPRREEKQGSQPAGGEAGLKSSHRSASEPDFAKSGKDVGNADKDSGPKSVGGGSSPVRKTFAGGFLRASSGIWGGLKSSLSSVVPVGGGSGNQAKLGDKNKFYYDEKKKKWVLEGEPEAEEEAPLPPPPMTGNFLTGGAGNTSSSVGPSNPPRASTSSQAPPGPPAVPRAAGQPPSSQGGALPTGGPAPPPVSSFSARGRTGVRSRYVDTFNKGGAAAAGPAKALALPARPLGPAPMKFFVPPPAPLGTIPDSESESDPPDQPTDLSEAPPGQSRDPPSTSGFQSVESSKPPLPHGHRRSHSSETSGHPPLYPPALSGGSHSAGGAGSPRKAHQRASSQPPPMNFFVPGPPVVSSSAQGDAGIQESGPASNGGAYSFAKGGGGESTSGAWDTLTGYESPQRNWPPQAEASIQHGTSSGGFGMPPPPDIGNGGFLSMGTETGTVGGADASNGSQGDEGNAFFNAVGTAGIVTGRPSSGGHAKESEVEEMTEVEL